MLSPREQSLRRVLKPKASLASAICLPKLVTFVSHAKQEFAGEGWEVCATSPLGVSTRLRITFWSQYERDDALLLDTSSPWASSRQASQSCAIFGHSRTGRKCQVRAFQHVVNTPRKTFPFRKMQLSPTSSRRDQSSTGRVHGPSLLASALAKQRWRVTRCSSVSSTSLDRASGTGLAVAVRERLCQ